jgi:hypothetical protein
MEDRELLLLAAKAAGMEVREDGMGNLFPTDSPYAMSWNPLIDDGDRYRLIKACGLNVNFANKTVKAYVDGREHRCYYFGDHPDHEAQRIVRAAAEIGAELHKESTQA